MAVTGSASQFLGFSRVIDDDGSFVVDVDGNRVVIPGSYVTQTAVGVVGTASNEVRGTADQTLDTVLNSASGHIGLRTFANQTLETVTQTALGGQESAAGTGPAPLPNVTQEALGSSPDSTRLTNTVAPVVSGTLTKGSTLSVTDGTWDSYYTPIFTYQWRRSGENIQGANSNTYVLVQADVGRNISAIVTAFNHYKVVSQVSNTVTISGRRAVSGNKKHKITDYRYSNLN